MAVHIRHGSPGSFKTACAVWFDILNWLRDGRPVYTNIRDIKSVEYIEEAIKEKFPEGAEIILVDTDSQQNRFKFACWFHWLPIGAALCIDEGQFIYPSRSDFKPNTLDYPGGLDSATEAKRPPDIFTALDKHRHYNWDICVTTPNIKKLPNWLRDVVETAYHHKNMEHIPFYGKRKTREHRHDPSTSGTTINKQSQYQLRKVPVKVHKLYGSTATGMVSKNRAEANPFKNPRFVSFIIFAFLSISSSIYLLFGDSDNIQSSAMSIPEVVVEESTTKDTSNVSSSISTEEISSFDPLVDASFLSGFFPGIKRIYISGHFFSSGYNNYFYNIDTIDSTYTLTTADLVSYGFYVKDITHCMQSISHHYYEYSFNLFCASSVDRSDKLERRLRDGTNPSDPTSHLPSIDL